MKKHNFSAGPCILPQEVFEKSAAAILDFNQSGLSILEISHRSKDFIAVMEEARALALELLGLTGKGYQALFLQGGASMEFLRIPYNLLPQDGKAAYLDTGTWANNAIKEAKLFGETVVVASSKDENYNHIPTNYSIPETASYFHCTSNNTIFGTQIKSFPETNVPIICDMSSDIFSRTLDFSKFDLIYAGAQKNMGAAGVNLVVLRKDMVGKRKKAIPAIMDYQQHIAAGSLMNTPPVFSVYVSMLTLRWIIREGGLPEMERRNRAKTTLLYNTLTNHPLFTTRVNPDSRSCMNAVFFLSNPALEAPFLELCKEQGMIGVKGYRTVGGIRVSMYNALELSSVQAFCDLINYFTEKNG
jgi:phosphoserine aminotransferase